MAVNSGKFSALNSLVSSSVIFFIFRLLITFDIDIIFKSLKVLIFMQKRLKKNFPGATEVQFLKNTNNNRKPILLHTASRNSLAYSGRIKLL